MHMLLVSEPVLGADEKAALAAVIDSGWVTMGDRVHEFESSSRLERDFIT
jgi:dTDP-4-amino-4,6-dideoxygalactose transaminase